MHKSICLLFANICSTIIFSQEKKFLNLKRANAVATSNNEDFGWNAVRDSAVKINDGWVVEMKIPYSALRFSNEEVQTWGMQVQREFSRSVQDIHGIQLMLAKDFLDYTMAS